MLQVSENCIADVVTGHDISMHILLAILARTVQATNALGLGHKILTCRALLASIVLVHTNHYVTKGSRLAKRDVIKKTLLANTQLILGIQSLTSRSKEIYLLDKK